MRFIILYLLLSNCFIANSQSFYYVRYDAAFDYYFGEFDVPSCQATDIIKINTAGFPQPVFFGDIAISPSGEVYCFISAFTSTFIVKLDVQNNTMSIVTNTPTNYNSMVCGADNILYLASGFGFYTYDLNTNIGTDLGPVNFQPSGDLTFINNQLYCTAIPNSLIQVNSNQMKLTMPRKQKSLRQKTSRLKCPVGCQQ